MQVTQTRTKSIRLNNSQIHAVKKLVDEVGSKKGAAEKIGIHYNTLANIIGSRKPSASPESVQAIQSYIDHAA